MRSMILLCSGLKQQIFAQGDEPSKGSPITDQEYFQLGIFKGLPTYNKGVVITNQPLTSGHLRGSAGTILGESGGGCFSLRDIIGITVGGYNGAPDLPNRQSISESLKQLEVVDRYTSHTVFVPIELVQFVIRKLRKDYGEEQEREPKPDI